LKDEPKPSFNQVPLFVSHTLTSDNNKAIYEKHGEGRTNLAYGYVNKNA